MRRFYPLIFTPVLLLLIFAQLLPASQKSPQPFTAEDLLKIEQATAAKISPDGKWIAFTKRVPRKANEKPGGAYSELYVVNTTNKEIRPFITGKVSVYAIDWRPDGKSISFLTRRGEKAKTQVWEIPVDGGEARQLTHSPTSVRTYRWHPNGQVLYYTAQQEPAKREKELKEKGYDFIFYEEEWKHINLYALSLKENSDPKQLTRDITVWSMEINHAGTQMALAASPRNLVDDEYTFTRLHILDLSSGKITKLNANEGKLDNFAFSPDDNYLAYTAALNKNDHAVSQLFLYDLKANSKKNLTPDNYKGHINWAGWLNSSEIIYLAHRGVWPVLYTVKKDGSRHKEILNSEAESLVFNAPSISANKKYFAFISHSSIQPREVYFWKRGKKMIRMTNCNPWLAQRTFGKQEVFIYKPRDYEQNKVMVEGLLVYPVNYKKGEKYPLVVYVHGGPEAHHSNGWLSYYSQPVQVMANKGYVVFLPNYRGSTGYGVDYAMKWHLGNAAGTEFDDIADGIDALAELGIADKNRVGLAGGSYGGFAAAWFGTYYTEKVKAVCMFVGISDLISKRGTTDIPYEELYVHSGKKLEEMWDFSLKRSPIYYAHKSKSAVLIYGGTDDPRVHPSQSLELYRRLKMNDHPAVRLVQYPGEGHGNRMQPGRIDVLYRTMDWLDWYVKDNKPLNGPMPPLDISDKYGLDLSE
ncbi:MAG: S9 family peptidase [Calditrichia bacterium]